jgi:hypothetical protein
VTAYRNKNQLASKVLLEHGLVKSKEELSALALVAD